MVVLQVWAEDPAFPGVQVGRRQQWDPAQQGVVGRGAGRSLGAPTQERQRSPLGQPAPLGRRMGWSFGPGGGPGAGTVPEAADPSPLLGWTLRVESPQASGLSQQLNNSPPPPPPDRPLPDYGLSVVPRWVGWGVPGLGWFPPTCTNQSSSIWSAGPLFAKRGLGGCGGPIPGPVLAQPSLQAPPAGHRQSQNRQP